MDLFVDLKVLAVGGSQWTAAERQREEKSLWSNDLQTLLDFCGSPQNDAVERVAVITLTVVVIVTLPTYRWKGRVWLDRMLPPWSIYRMLQGTTFLLNMAVMLNAGIRPYDSLASMIKISPPWLKQRLEAARYGVGLGQNLGVALRSAGHDFPDRQAIQYLCILANRGGFSEALVKFSRRWQETSLKQIELAAGLVKNFALIFIGALMILVLLGAYQAQQLIQSMNH